MSEIDNYINGFPEETKSLLNQIRATIKSIVPEAEEKISYGMPSFYLNGALVYYAGYKNHIGFYPVPSGMKAFKEELSVYKQGKGSVQFPFDKPIPFDLITEIVKFRMNENLEKAKVKKRK